jgi:hypothetical protein
VLGADYIGPGAHAIADAGLVRLDGTALLRQPTPSPSPSATPAPGDDDAPITAEGITCVN